MNIVPYHYLFLANMHHNLLDDSPVVRQLDFSLFSPFSIMLQLTFLYKTLSKPLIVCLVSYGTDDMRFTEFGFVFFIFFSSKLLCSKT